MTIYEHRTALCLYTNTVQYYAYIRTRYSIMPILQVSERTAVAGGRPFETFMVCVVHIKSFSSYTSTSSTRSVHFAAHPVAVQILRPREIQAPWSQNYCWFKLNYGNSLPQE